VNDVRASYAKMLAAEPFAPALKPT